MKIKWEDQILSHVSCELWEMMNVFFINVSSMIVLLLLIFFQFSKKKTQKFLFLRDPFREDFICFPFRSIFFLTGIKFIFFLPSSDPKFLFLFFCFPVSKRRSLFKRWPTLFSLSLSLWSKSPQNEEEPLICYLLEVLTIFLVLNLCPC